MEYKIWYYEIKDTFHFSNVKTDVIEMGSILYSTEWLTMRFKRICEKQGRRFLKFTRLPVF